MDAFDEGRSRRGRATMDAGKIREGVLVILAGFAVRIALAARYVKQG